MPTALMPGYCLTALMPGMRPQKITFGEMRDMGVRGIPVYCADYHCSHSVALNADRWADELRLSDIELRFDASAHGHSSQSVFWLGALCKGFFAQP